GLLGGNSLDWVVGQLAAWHAGKVVVPLPPFFSAPQLRHVVQDSGISHVLCASDAVETARLLGVPFTPVSERRASFVPLSEPGGSQIIYTSGSTGQPKGVLLAGGQMIWSAGQLTRASGALADDSYLSVMPLALLLETICAVIAPLFVGASVRIESSLAKKFGETDVRTISEIVAANRPTCMVLVPHLLAAWVAQLHGASAKAPNSLRFVAVGGAAVPTALAQSARDLGIPVFEGYGLTECGSVVALNRPGDRRPGTAGKPLPGLDVRIENHEIVVRGPPVMDRYLHGSSTQGTWRTGDVGQIDADGFLTVQGRIDNLLVSPMGRNISPEWIESLIVTDPRIAFCVVTYAGGPNLKAILVPTAQGEKWFERAAVEEIGTLVAACCRDAPAYATPRAFCVVRAIELVRLGLLTGNNRIRRKALLEEYASELGSSGKASTSVVLKSIGQ
ncbi:MAG: AMP-binding protein, partial [Alphaproteobacteria bacterium]